jgi:hypothetical protein
MSKCALEAIYGWPSADSHGQSVRAEVEVLVWPAASATLVGDKVTSFTVVAH